ncbi:P63C domain-containing protein [Paenibacillus sp. HW567]|uniref:P63C domain-containing protein n=1 Tax=Paenibacillus sp. HW567 TaxID=1034769 RepID=UPI000361A1CA|nr:P63C domain-containing protein [Paenibacillus sp. HW567]
MDNEVILKATHKGVLNIADKKLSCAVLEDGTRIISIAAVFRAFGRTKRGRLKDEVRVADMPDLPSFIDANNLVPFINDELKEFLKPVSYMNGKKVFQGYRAQIIPLMCNVYLEARDQKKLTKQQEPIAIVSDILVRSLAKIGILALIDEATGYQDVRERNELQKILKAYISEELLPWTKRFPDEFYKEIFRLNGWAYDPGSISRPGIIGKWTNQLVYEQLPSGVLEELKQVNPPNEKGNRKNRHHQHLSLDIGNSHLEKQLVSVITLMNVSGSWGRFMTLFRKKYGGQQEFDFEDN